MWYPYAIRKEVARHRTPMASYRGIVMHVAAVEADSLFGFFNQPGNPTSHFYIRYTGVVEQYVDTRYRAPAQLEGNPNLIGIETEGLGSGLWRPAQVDSILPLWRWLNTQHAIPLVMMPDSKSTRRGIAPHRWGIDPYRVAGGEQWSTSFAKACPGSDRVKQLPQLVALVQEDGMTDAELLAQFQGLKDHIDNRTNGPTGLHVALGNVRDELKAAIAAAGGAGASPEAIADAVLAKIKGQWVKA